MVQKADGCGQTALQAERGLIRKVRPQRYVPDRPSLRWVYADACALPFDAGSFDVVTCTLVLGHVEHLEDALSEISRVLKPDGWIVISGFHPFATLLGWERTFADPASGRTVAIAQHLHLFGQYVRSFNALGWRLDVLEEPCFEGVPIAFVLRAAKEVRG